MEIFSIILIAIGLSMDSFAVSISNGLTIRNLKVQGLLTISFSLAIFQAVMPLIGWFVGNGIESYIEEIDHWVAFILLSFIGAKMMYEGFQDDDEIKESELKTLTLIGQSIATSIDAFAVGISFALLDQPILNPILIIGVVTFGFSLLGLQIGKYFGKQLGHIAEIAGGILLIGIGIKILIEHLYFM